MLQPTVKTFNLFTLSKFCNFQLVNVCIVCIIVILNLGMVCSCLNLSFQRGGILYYA